MKLISKKLSFRIILGFLLLLVIPSTNTVLGLPENQSFDDPNQSICYVLDELDKITIDGNTVQSTQIRAIVNLAAQEISNNTVITISDEPCFSLEVNLVTSLDFQNAFTDGFVFELPLNQELEWKEITFNTHDHFLSGPHAYSTFTDCSPITENPNLQYVTNHELAHFAGLDHVPENDDENTDFMSRNCNLEYATLPQNYADDINSLYPNFIPSWIKNNAGWWADGSLNNPPSDPAGNNQFLAGITFLVNEGIIQADVQDPASDPDPIVPDWIKDVAGWWADDVPTVDDATFLNAIEYLMKNNIIVIDTSDSLFENPIIQNIVADFLEDFTTKLSFIDSLIIPAFALTGSTITPIHLSNVDCTDDCFTPDPVEVDVGTQITFSNTANVAHTFTSGNAYDGPDGNWDSGLLVSGDTYSVTLDQEGTYQYYSQLSPWMTGKIVVGSIAVNQPPTADAGNDQSVDEGTTVFLSGLGTDPEVLPMDYRWTQISGPSVLLSGTNVPGQSSTIQNPIFTAPDVTVDTDLIFRFTVTDRIPPSAPQSLPESAYDTMTITVQDVITPPINQIPISNAGIDQSVDENTLVTLDGSASFDPDPDDDITYLWEQTSGVEVDLDDITAQSPTFIAPEVNGITNLAFKLIVRDELNFGSVPDYVTITINNVEAPPENTAPIANNDVRIVIGTDPIILDILFNDEDLDDDSIVITSVDTAGTIGTVEITNNGNDVTFTADSDSTYTTTFMYTISDGSLPDTAMVTVDVIELGDTGNAIWYTKNPGITANANFGESTTVLANGKVVGAAPGELGKLFVLNGITGDSSLPVFIDNPNAIFGESFGSDSASLGNNIIVGNSGYDAGIETDAGQVYVFSDDNVGTILFGGPIQNPEPNAFDEFGDAVSASGNLIFVGAPGNNVIVNESLTNNASAQSPTFDDSVNMKLLVDDTTNNTAQLIDNVTFEPITENFSVIQYNNKISQSISLTEGEEDILHDELAPTLEIDDIAGTMTLMDSTTNETIISVTKNSSQYLTSLQNNNNLVLFSNQEIGTSYLFDTMSGQLLLTEFSGAGSVYVFDGATGSYLSPPIDNPNPVSHDNFGASLASFGDEIVVGVPGDDDNGPSSGSIYTFNGITKSQIHFIPNPSIGGGDSDDFGISVGFAGGMIVVGSPDDDDSDIDTGAGTNDGAIYLFDGTTGENKDFLPNPNPDVTTSADMGESVSINDNGIVVAGAPDSESVFVFSFDGANTTFVKEIQNPETAVNEDFGTSVIMLNDDNVIIGIPGDDPNTSGAIALYSSTPPPNIPPVAFDDDDNYTATNDTPIVIDILANDDGDSLLVDSVNTLGTQGAVINNGDNVTFTANLNFDGITTFSYKAIDGSNTLSNTATVSVTVSDTLAPIIALTGDNPQTIEVGQGYVELGATTDDGSEIISDSLEFTDALGTYTIYYDSVDVNGNVANTVTRTVNVVDVTSPEIFIPSNQTFEASSLNTPLSESNYGTATATDDVDSNPVISSDAPATFPLGITNVTWTATDSSGNISADIQIITLHDTTDPVITLIGNNPQIIDLGDIYAELGSTALDNIDGDISANIIIDSSAVDVDAAGSYPVRYDVIDSSGNSSITVFRNILVISDTAPPQIDITSHIHNQIVTTSDITILGTATDAESTITQVTVSVNGGVEQPAVLDTNTDPNTWSLDLTNLTDDTTYSIIATATNDAGLSDSTNQIDITVDLAPPPPGPNPTRSSSALSEDFEGTFSWTQIGSGNVSQKASTAAVSGDFVALKKNNGDPNGAYIPLTQSVDDFEVILYTKRTFDDGNNANKYSILQDSTGNGYGFNLNSAQLIIEKRSASLGATAIATDNTIGWDMHQWNTIRFLKQGDTLRLDLFKNQIISHDTIHTVLPDSTLTVNDSTYSGGFNYAAINGGYKFHTDDYYVWSLDDSSLLKQILDKINTDRVDFVGLGAINMNCCGAGWDHGFQYALSDHDYPMYATGMIAFNENNGWGAGSGYQYQAQSIFPQGANVGAPVSLDQYDGPSLIQDYAYIDDVNTVSGFATGMGIWDISPIDVHSNLRFDFHYGTFENQDGSGEFTPAIRRGNAPYTVLATHPSSPIPTVTGSYGLQKTSMSLPAETRDYHLEAGFTLPGQGDIQGPFFGNHIRAINTDRDSGFSFNLLAMENEFSLRDIAEELQNTDDVFFTHYFGNIRDVQLESPNNQNKANVVILISSGFKDQYEYNTSVGPAQIPAGNSAEAYKDNAQAIINEITEPWSNNNWDESELYFVFMPVQEVENPDRQIIEEYRTITQELIGDNPTLNVAVLDFTDFISNTDIINNGWSNSSTQSIILNPAGYEGMASLALDHILGITATAQASSFSLIQSSISSQSESIVFELPSDETIIHDGILGSLEFYEPVYLYHYNLDTWKLENDNSKAVTNGLISPGSLSYPLSVAVTLGPYTESPEFAILQSDVIPDKKDSNQKGKPGTEGDIDPTLDDDSMSDARTLQLERIITEKRFADDLNYKTRMVLSGLDYVYDYTTLDKHDVVLIWKDDSQQGMMPQIHVDGIDITDNLADYDYDHFSSSLPKNLDKLNSSTFEYPINDIHVYGAELTDVQIKKLSEAYK